MSSARPIPRIEFLDLPDELVDAAIRLLDVPDLAVVSCVSKRLKGRASAILDDLLEPWRHVYVVHGQKNQPPRLHPLLQQLPLFTPGFAPGGSRLRSLKQSVFGSQAAWTPSARDVSIGLEGLEDISRSASVVRLGVPDGVQYSDGYSLGQVIEAISTELEAVTVARHDRCSIDEHRWTGLEEVVWGQTWAAGRPHWVTTARRYCFSDAPAEHELLTATWMAWSGYGHAQCFGEGFWEMICRAGADEEDFEAQTSSSVARPVGSVSSSTSPATLGARPATSGARPSPPRRTRNRSPASSSDGNQDD
ncbi:hypothetical protein OF846_000735 [Rhodotorula toruloides]|nr:hypothetical protein OF846_000735 [Rhodotorula toruloides]KAJ8296348.1 hypothetical protein OF846_000735 [Rhodotorula toruloides]